MTVRNTPGDPPVCCILQTHIHTKSSIRDRLLCSNCVCGWDRAGVREADQSGEERGVRSGVERERERGRRRGRGRSSRRWDKLHGKQAGV